MSAINVPSDSIDSLVVPSGLRKVVAVDPSNSPSVVTSNAVWMTLSVQIRERTEGIRQERIMFGWFVVVVVVVVVVVAMKPTVVVLLFVDFFVARSIISMVCMNV
jgi:hypothetical protein